ncbi:hypothetical protein LQZ18_09860 [Lachnospiraceae bacterium ZAX-1]
MDSIKTLINDGKNNFIFIGGAGSGKSEIAVNFTNYILKEQEKPVHFFDMDMTKPLFRSRDLGGQLEKIGIIVHYEEQFMDAPTLVGGTKELLKNKDCYVVMDVGGDHIGARAIGGVMSGINRDKTVIYYVLNAFRPWSDDILHIDETLGEILSSAHVKVEELHLINNPNFGYTTTLKEAQEGFLRMRELTSPYRLMDFTCIREELYEEAKQEIDMELMPLHLYLTYPWLAKEA